MDNKTGIPPNMIWFKIFKDRGEVLGKLGIWKLFVHFHKLESPIMH